MAALTSGLVGSIWPHLIGAIIVVTAGLALEFIEDSRGCRRIITDELSGSCLDSVFEVNACHI